MDKDYYLIQSLRNYKTVSYGQFDKETYHTVQETQDAANRIEELLNEINRKNSIIKERTQEIIRLENEIMELNKKKG